MCHVYLMGVFDGLLSSQDITITAIGMSKGVHESYLAVARAGEGICLEQPVSAEQLRIVVIDFLGRNGGAHPKISAAHAVYGALNEQFPCKN